MTDRSDEEWVEWWRRRATDVESSGGAPPYEAQVGRSRAASRDAVGAQDRAVEDAAGWRREARSVPGSWPYDYALPKGAGVAEYRQHFEAAVGRCGACWGAGMIEVREVSREDELQASAWTEKDCPRCQGTGYPILAEPDGVIEPDSIEWTAEDEARAAAEWAALDARPEAVTVEGHELRDDPSEAVPAWERADVAQDASAASGREDDGGAGGRSGDSGLAWSESWTVDVGESSGLAEIGDSGVAEAELEYPEGTGSEVAWCDAGDFEVSSDPGLSAWADADLDYGDDTVGDSGSGDDGGSSGDVGGSAGGAGAGSDGDSGSGSDSG